MWGRQDDVTGGTQGTVTATGLWNSVTESRKACLRKGDSARERGLVFLRRANTGDRQLNYPSQLGRNSQGPIPTLVTSSDSVFMSVRWGEQLLLLTKEQMR